MKELTFNELDMVSAGTSTTGQNIGNDLMAIGAASVGVGALFGQPEIVTAGAVIAGVGGLVYLASK